MFKILMVASEAIPFAKTGGLADVTGSLPVALRRLGHEVAVLLPRYGGLALPGARRIYDSLPIFFGPARYDCSLSTVTQDVPFYFLDCPPLYNREGYYGDAEGDYPDNHIRFAVLSRAALAVVRYIFRPQIIHCHDWQTALVPTYLRTLFYCDPTFMSIKTLFTIHNLGYQGLFPKSALHEVGLDDRLFHPDGLEFFGKLNLLKGGLIFSDFLSTVSKAYAREILTPEYGFGLDGVLRARRDVLFGILNGVDYSQWNPATDPYIPANYSARDLSGKQICKRELMREFELPASAIDRPLLGMVSRLAAQKGADLVAAIADDLAHEDLYLIAIGRGDAPLEEAFRKLAEDYPGRISVRIEFDEALAHRVEAGADMFLMPSRYEPCGLNQIYSLRYGTVPVVRATGGLDDTIEEGTGFKFSEYSGEALLRAVRAACSAYHNRELWTAMMRRGMQLDYSWEVSAAEYSELYQRLMGLESLSRSMSS